MSFLKILFISSIRNIKNKEKIIDTDRVIPSLPLIKLLKIPSIYCIIEIWPNLKWTSETPDKILCSLIKLVKGKWYKNESGL